MANLHAYSPTKVLLVLAQHAAAFAEGRVSSLEPGYIAGFQTWRALGRRVEKGQHGYAVLAPRRRLERVAVDTEGRPRRLGRAESAGPDEIGEARPAVRG